MGKAFGGLKRTGGSAGTIAAAAGTKVTGWSACGVSKNGEAGVTEDTTNSRLTSKIHNAKFAAHAQISLETSTVGGTSGDAVGDIYVELRKNGTAFAKAKQHIPVVDLPVSVALSSPVELSIDDYVELYLVAVDASGNDVTIREAQLWLGQLA